MRRREQRFAQALHVAPVGTCLRSLDYGDVDKGTFLEVTEAFLELIGYTREEVVGRDIYTPGMWSAHDDRDALTRVRRPSGSSCTA